MKIIIAAAVGAAVSAMSAMMAYAGDDPILGFAMIGAEAGEVMAAARRPSRQVCRTRQL